MTIEETSDGFKAEIIREEDVDIKELNKDTLNKGNIPSEEDIIEQKRQRIFDCIKNGFTYLSDSAKIRAIPHIIMMDINRSNLKMSQVSMYHSEIMSMIRIIDEDKENGFTATFEKFFNNKDWIFKREFRFKLTDKMLEDVRNLRKLTFGDGEAICKANNIETEKDFSIIPLIGLAMYALLNDYGFDNPSQGFFIYPIATDEPLCDTDVNNPNIELVIMALLGSGELPVPYLWTDDQIEAYTKIKSQQNRPN
jgi:hypothetical protein